MATLTVYPVAGENSPVDGVVSRQGVTETFTSLRTGAGNSAAVLGGLPTAAAALYPAATSVRYTSLFRGIFCFDTSALPDGATINSAVLSLYGDSKYNGLGSPDLHIVSATPNSTSTLVDADYSQLGTTSFASITYAGFSTSGYNDFTLNAAGIANINKIGITKFGTRLSWDGIGAFGGVWNDTLGSGFDVFFADAAGTSKDPKLVIDYTEATTPTVTTQAVTNIASATATGNGNVTSDGNATITERGVAYNTTGTPTTADDTATASGTTGVFQAAMSGLAGGTLYYVRAYATNSEGTSYGSEVSFTTGGFTDPTNAYSSNDSYATVAAASGDISVQLSGDAGATWSSTLTKTFTGTESTLTYGNGSTELWGTAWTGDNVDDTSFRVRLTVGSTSQIYKTFGFAPGASVVLTGIEVAVEAKWDGATTSIDHVKVKIYYGTSSTPVQAGSLAYDSDENTIVYYDGSAWQSPGGGSGDVTGPASATDNAVVRFDGTGGKTIQDSVVTIADTTGNMAGVGTVNTLTLPASNFVGLTDSQTLTQKTLTSPTINTPTLLMANNAAVQAKNAAGTSKNLINKNASDQTTIGENDVRATRFVAVTPSEVVASVDPANTNWVSVDLTSATSATCYCVFLLGRVLDTAGAARNLYVRQTGSGLAQGIETLIASTSGSANSSYGSVPVGVDTSQSFDWSVSNADVDGVGIVLRGYWEYVD